MFISLSLLFGAIVFAGISVVVYLNQTVLVQSASLNAYRYHLLLRYEFDTPAYYMLYKCDPLNRKCNVVHRFPAEANYPGGDQEMISPKLPTFLVIDPSANVLFVREGYNAIYEYHP